MKKVYLVIRSCDSYLLCKPTENSVRFEKEKATHFDTVQDACEAAKWACMLDLRKGLFNLYKVYQYGVSIKGRALATIGQNDLGDFQKRWKTNPRLQKYTKNQIGDIMHHSGNSIGAIGCGIDTLKTIIKENPEFQGIMNAKEDDPRFHINLKEVVDVMYTSLLKWESFTQEVEKNRIEEKKRYFPEGFPLEKMYVTMSDDRIPTIANDSAMTFRELIAYFDSYGFEYGEELVLHPDTPPLLRLAAIEFITPELMEFLENNCPAHLTEWFKSHEQYINESWNDKP